MSSILLERAVFCIYMSTLLLLGYLGSKRINIVDDYMLGGRTIGPVFTAISHQSTAMSGYMFMGGPAYAYQVGYFGLWYGIGDGGGGIFDLAVLGKRMRRLSEKLGALTPIEYLEKRYESPAVRVVGAAIAGIFLAAYVFAQFIAGGKALAMLLDINYGVALLIGLGIMVTYTFLGGYLTVVWSDFMNGMLMVCSIFTMFILGLIKAGGFTAVHHKIASIDPSYLSIWGKDYQYLGQWGVLLGAVLIYFIGYTGMPHIIVRHMSMKSHKNVRPAIMWVSIWNLFFVYSPYLLGIIGIVLLPNLADPEMIIPTLAHSLFPGVIAALVLSALMAAVISTADSQLVQLASILSRDVYQRFINPQANSKQMVIVSRLLVVVVGIVGFFIAYFQPPTIFGLVVFAWGVLGNTFMVPYIAAVYWPEANKAGALGAMIGGGLTNIIWTVLKLEAITAVHPFFAGLIVSIVCMLIFNRFSAGVSDTVRTAVQEASGGGFTIPPKLAAGMSKILIPEAREVGRFLISNRRTNSDGLGIEVG